jgi:DNA-binding transcriptional MerR regulator
MNQAPSYTTGALARHFGCEPWQIRRLFERGLLPPAQRVGAYRVIPASELPAVERALQTAGYLPAQREALPCR